LHDVVAASYVDGYRLELEFDDGARGVVDFSEFLHRGGVFERLRAPESFKRFQVDPELGVVTWGGEVDVAPETLYAKATGTPLPEWMEA
jgi:hypothetical protein